MKEKPILFKGEMVRAVLDGSKTQTRRVITVPWNKGKRCLPYQPYYVEEDGKLLYMADFGDYHNMLDLCPYGLKGDQLWVRETFAEKDGLVAYRADGQCGAWMGDGDGGRLLCHHGWIIDAPHDREGERFGLPRFGGRWKPSIHMYRKHSRIQLEVTDVRVERVQDISEEDAIAEGVERTGGGRYWLGYSLHDVKGTRLVWGSARRAFEDLWDSINNHPPKRPYGWDANPWVWSVTFKKI